MRLLKFFLVLLLTMVFSACSSKVHVQPPISQPPLVEKEPGSVGVFYSEDLRKHKCSAGKGYIAESWVIELGPASIEMFNLIFNSLFQEVKVVDSVNSALEKGMKGLIEVRLLDFSGCEARWPIFGATIEVAYEATLRGEDGAVVATWQGRGQSVSGDSNENCRQKGPSLDVEGRYLGTMTCIAMREAAADFIVNFHKDARIGAYLGK